RGGRGGVGDAHVPGDQAPVAPRYQAGGGLGPRDQGRRGLGAGPWGAFGELRGAAGGLGRQQPAPRFEGGRPRHADPGDPAAGRAGAATGLPPAPPARKLAPIWAATSCGHGVTPWACTPWSAANTATQAGSGSGGGQSPASPASRTDPSSSTPSEPRGLVIRS